jgi:hypothetical protein
LDRTLIRLRLSALFLCLCGLLSGCASRSQIREDNPIRPAADLYNRNFVVAAPTYAANLVCGAPFFLLSAGIDSVYLGERTENYYQFINNVYLVPAVICGAVAGAAFVPISYACGEHPWDFDFKTIRSRSWACR